MDDHMYDPLHQQAVQLNFKFNDFVGGDHPELSALRHEVRELVEDLESKKHPRTIEGRIKVIQNQLKQTQHMGPDSGIDYREFDLLHDNYERMKQNLRRFDNY